LVVVVVVVTIMEEEGEEQQCQRLHVTYVVSLNFIRMLSSEHLVVSRTY
jgi:hypothetical protein